jgi:hypothetical protein
MQVTLDTYCLAPWSHQTRQFTVCLTFALTISFDLLLLVLLFVTGMPFLETTEEFWDALTDVGFKRYVRCSLIVTV